jgi:transposase-like protein
MSTIKSYQAIENGKKKYRYFSEEFRKKIVSEIERNILTVTEVSREYGVSPTSVYRWLWRYSRQRKNGGRQVVEIESDTRKLKALKEELKELHRIIGQKQIQIDFQNKLIELAEEEYKVDIKKKYGKKLYSGSGITEQYTDTK